MKNDWLRLWHDLPNDPKWRTIARASGQNITTVIAVYIHMLVSASTATERGRTQPNADENIANALDIELSAVTAIRDAMQGRVLDSDRMTGWDRRQPKREDGSAERSKTWRAEQAAKKAAEEEDERNRTQPNANDPKRREDKNIRREDKSSLSLCAQGFEIFWHLFPRQRRGDRDKALSAYRKAIERASAEEILAGVKAYAESDEVERGFAKGCVAWLSDSRWTWDYKSKGQNNENTRSRTAEPHWKLKPTKDDRLRAAALRGIGIDPEQTDGGGQAGSGG